MIQGEPHIGFHHPSSHANRSIIRMLLVECAIVPVFILHKVSTEKIVHGASAAIIAMEWRQIIDTE